MLTTSHLSCMHIPTVAPHRCILGMDHYCPWLNNTIGHFNHRHFFLFMMYMWLGVAYVAWKVALFSESCIVSPPLVSPNVGRCPDAQRLRPIALTDARRLCVVECGFDPTSAGRAPPSFCRVSHGPNSEFRTIKHRAVRENRIDQLYSGQSIVESHGSPSQRWRGFP